MLRVTIIWLTAIMKHSSVAEILGLLEYSVLVQVALSEHYRVAAL